jgi:PAS domain S-box-containing protein
MTPRVDKGLGAHAPHSDELFEWVLDSAADFALIGISPAGAVTQWNAGAERLFHYSPAEILGFNGDVIFTPEDRAQGVPASERSVALSEGRTARERWYQRKDGSRFWGAGWMAPLADGHGFIKVLRDLTAIRESKDRLREDDALFSVLGTHIPQLVFRSHRDGECSWVSAQWCTYTGVAFEDNLGLGWLDAIHPDDREPTLAAWGTAQTTGEYTVEHRILQAAEGRYRWHQTRARRVSGDSLAADWIGTSTDVDDLHSRRKRDAFLLELNDAIRPLADPIAIQETAMRMLCTHLELRRAVYYALDPEETHAYTVSSWGDAIEPAVAAEHAQIDLVDHLVATYKSGQPAVWYDAETDAGMSDELRAAFLASRVRAAVGLPLVKNERLVAVLGVQTEQPRNWSAHELHLIQEVAERTWAAVERSRAEAEMSAAQERYRALFNSIDQGFCTIEVKFDAQGRPVDFLFLEVSPSFERQTGIKNGAGRWMREIAPEQDEYWFEIFGRVALSGEPVRYESSSTPIGRWWSIYAFKISGPNRIAVLFHDITERKQAEAALRASEKSLTQLNEKLGARVAERTAELRQTWRLSRDLLTVIRRDKVIVAVNQAWTETLGWEERELVGKTFMEFTHPDDLQTTIAAFESTFNAPLTEPYEYRLRHKQGGYRWIAWTAAFSNGRLFANGRDVTEQRARQDELERTQEALRQTQKLESMGQLTGGVAHDFNNLLTPILGCLDMLQRRGLNDAREQRMVSGAIQSAERAKVLVQRLLAFARRQPLQPTAIDVAELTREMGGLLASTTGPQIKVIVDAPAGLPPARADANQLEMALLNLAVNARDAMPHGGTLQISVDAELVGEGHRAGLEPGRYLRLSVKDTGEGMDEETRKRAIEPFFSTKGVGKGTGLGLSMVHGLALQLGGGLDIRSTPGLGTHIELWLPQSAQPTAPQQAALPEVPSTECQGAVLLVDDEELVRFSTSDMLNELGYSVIEASSAEEALELMQRASVPDYVITDQLMPGMSGTELARMLLNKHPQLKVLVISGFADVDAIAPDLPRRTKPFRSAELAASLASLS